MSRELYHNDWLLDRIKGIVRDHKSVEAKWYSLFKRSANDVVDYCFDTLHGMSEGYLIAPSGWRGPEKADALAQVKEGGIVKAVAAVDEQYWRTPEGHIWLRANADAIGRGVKIIRIFTYSMSTLQGMVDVLENQRELGIQVRLAPDGTFPSTFPIQLNHKKQRFCS